MSYDHENRHDERPDPDCRECRLEMDESYREAMAGYRAEREMAQAMKLARRDLDMGLDVDEAELMAAIQRRFKR